LSCKSLKLDLETPYDHTPADEFIYLNEIEEGIQLYKNSNDFFKAVQQLDTVIALSFLFKESSKMPLLSGLKLSRSINNINTLRLSAELCRTLQNKHTTMKPEKEYQQRIEDLVLAKYDALVRSEPMQNVRKHWFVIYCETNSLVSV
jgi:hypothetical protein